MKRILLVSQCSADRSSSIYCTILLQRRSLLLQKTSPPKSSLSANPSPTASSRSSGRSHRSRISGSLNSPSLSSRTWLVASDTFTETQKSTARMRLSTMRRMRAFGKRQPRRGIESSRKRRDRQSCSLPSLRDPSSQEDFSGMKDSISFLFWTSTLISRECLPFGWTVRFN